MASKLRRQLNRHAPKDLPTSKRFCMRCNKTTGFELNLLVGHSECTECGWRFIPTIMRCDMRGKGAISNLTMCPICDGSLRWESVTDEIGTQTCQTCRSCGERFHFREVFDAIEKFKKDKAGVK